MTSPDAILQVRNLGVVFDSLGGQPVRAVSDVSFDLLRGETLTLVGESGSGKSVTAYSVLRLIQAPGRIAEGTITLTPHQEPPIEIIGLPARSPVLRRVRGGLVGMIFQEPMTALSPVIPIGKQIAEAALLHRAVTRQEADRLAVTMIGQVGIPEPEKRFRQYPFEFSGGMRQRVVIAMALVARPQVLIADEPTTALDVTVQAQIIGLVNDLKAKRQMSVLFITHDLGVVAQVADRVLVMRRSEIVEEAGVRDLYARPYHPYTRRLLSLMPRLDDRPPAFLSQPLPAPVGVPDGFTLEESTLPADTRLVTLPDGRRVRVSARSTP